MEVIEANVWLVCDALSRNSSNKFSLVNLKIVYLQCSEHGHAKMNNNFTLQLKISRKNNINMLCLFFLIFRFNFSVYS